MRERESSTIVGSVRRESGEYVVREWGMWCVVRVGSLWCVERVGSVVC